MIQQALVEPALKSEQVSQMPAGLARFLVDRINAISGINTPRDALAELVQAHWQERALCLPGVWFGRPNKSAG